MSPVIFSRTLYRVYYSRRLTKILIVFPSGAERVAAAVYGKLFSFCLGLDRYLAFTLCGFDPLLTAEYFEEAMESCERLKEENSVFRKKWQAKYYSQPQKRLGDLTITKILTSFGPAERLARRIKNSFLFKK